MQESTETQPISSDLPELNEASGTKDNRDRKDIITPYAFGVSDGLYGVPLASPIRRLFALGIDLILIAALSGVSGHALTISIAILLFIVSKRFKKEDRFRRWRRSLTIFASLIVVVSIISMLFPEKSATNSSDTPPTIDEVIKDIANRSALEGGGVVGDIEKGVEIVNEIQKVQESQSQVKHNYSVISLIQGIATDFGIGFGWAAVYFTLLTTLFRGQTFGKLILGIRIIKLDGCDLNIWESFGRYGGYGAGVATGLLGFFQIFWDANRQAIQDKISETLVIDKRKPKELYTPKTTK